MRTHIIEEAGFLSLLLSNRGSYRAKSPWWQADVELGGVGERKEIFGRDVSLAGTGGGVDVQVFVSYFWMW